MGAEQLGPAVGLTGVGVHNTACQLDQLAHMPDQKHLLKMLGHRHIQRVTDKIGDLYNRNICQLRHISGKIVQPVVAGCQNQAAAPQRGLMDLQLQRVEDSLLAHRLHYAAGAQHRQSALDPDVGVESAPRGFLAAVNADDDRKAAGIPGRLRLFCQRLGDHTARHMVDGRRAQRLVQPRLCHAAHTVPAVDRNGAGGIRQQRDLRHHRQTGRGIYVIAAVLDDGTFSTLRCQAAALRGNLHNKTFGCTQPDCLGRTAGQQQPCRPRRTQRRTGAGGVAASQQLLPAADVMFKFRLGIVFSVQGRILLRCQIKQGADVILGKGSLG